MPNIIFVGAGPVGLFTAIQIKLKDPDLSIVMFEKHAEYQRRHVLIIEPTSYLGSHPDEKFQQILSELHGAVRTSIIEQKLLDFAKDLGINIQLEAVLSVEDLAARFPEASVIIGADGAHSLVRNQVFGERLETREDLQFIAELKYEVNGVTRPLNIITEYLPATTQVNHLVTEAVGRVRDGKTPVSVRTFIDEDTFNALKTLGVTFKTPLKLNNVNDTHPREIQRLRDTMNAWLIMRKDLTQEERLPESELVTATNLAVYRSKLFALEHHRKSYFLVGDAAMGVPYFRALNTGLLSGSQLAGLIYEHFHPKPHAQNEWSSFSKIERSLDEVTVIEKYNRKMTQIANSEISWARVKNSGVVIGDCSAASSREIPVSSSFLPRETIGRIRNARLVDEADQISSTSLKTSGCTIM